MKKYLLFTLKRYIPLFVVAFALCFFTFISVFGGLPTSQTIRSYYDSETGMAYSYSNTLSGINSGMIFVFVLVAIFTIILPFFANSYRYSLQSADTFYQIGKNKKSIRWVNNLVLLVMFIAVMTASFIFGVLILFFRQLPNIGRPDEVINTGGSAQEVTHYLFYNFGYYIPVYLLTVVFAVLNYAVSYLFITRANNLVDSILLLILGEFVLSVGVMTPFWFFLICGAAGGGWSSIVDESLLIGTRTASFVSPIAFILYAFDGLITGEGSLLVEQYKGIEFNGNIVLGLVISILCLVIYVAIAGLGIFVFLKEKESSGELAGKPVGRDRWQEIIFHTGAGMAGLWICCLQSLTGGITTILANEVFSFILLISEVGFYAAAYYVLYGLLRRNFRLTKRDIPLMAGIVGTNFIIGLSLLIAFLVNDAGLYL